MTEGRWTKDDVATLVAMLRDGRTTEEAAHALGRTVPAIWQYMRHHRSVFQGLPERRGGLRVRAMKMGGGAYMRRCHDCGAMDENWDVLVTAFRFWRGDWREKK